LEYGKEPEHLIFGAPALYMIRLPLESTAGKGKSSSWKTRVASLASTVESLDCAWLLLDVEDYGWNHLDRHFLKEYPGRASAVQVGALASLHRAAYSSSLGEPGGHWHEDSESLSVPIETRFVHGCHNGHASHPGERFGCINGIQHGFFGDAKSYTIIYHQECDSCRNLDKKKVYDVYLTILQLLSQVGACPYQLYSQLLPTLRP